MVTNDDSILVSIKSLLGSAIDDHDFDTDIVILINGAIFALQQLGVGPSSGFSITSEAEKWSDLLGAREDLNAAHTYVYLKVRLVFDPPTNSFLVKAIEDQIKELDVRLNIQAEGGTN